MSTLPAGPMQNPQISYEGNDTYIASFNAVTYAQGLRVDYHIEMTFLRPNSGPILTQHELEKIVKESLSDLTSKLAR